MDCNLDGIRLSYFVIKKFLEILIFTYFNCNRFYRLIEEFQPFSQLLHMTCQPVCAAVSYT